MFSGGLDARVITTLQSQAKKNQLFSMKESCKLNKVKTAFFKSLIRKRQRQGFRSVETKEFTFVNDCFQHENNAEPSEASS